MEQDKLVLADVERAIETMVEVAVQNEKYFCDLDGEMGDADFGKSLADGFRAIAAQRASIDRSSIGTYLVKVGMIFSSSVGGTSGPIWGTAFLRAGMAAKGKESLALSDLVQMGRSALEGMMARGKASPGDKTVIDAIVPALEELEKHGPSARNGLISALHEAANASLATIETTRQWQAKRGRQSYAADRTIGTLDPGIVAFATMLQAVVKRLEATG